MGITTGSTAGRQLAIEVDLPRLKGDLLNALNMGRHTRQQRREATKYLETLKRINLPMAEQGLKIEEARLVLQVAECRGTDGKALYSNDGARTAALTVLKGTDADYLQAQDVVRSVERQLIDAQADVQEADDETKSLTDLTWNLRTLIEGACAEIQAVTSLDGPAIPAEITLTLPTGPLRAELSQTQPLQAQLTQTAPLRAELSQSVPLVAHVTQTAPLQVAATIQTPETPKEAA